MNDCLASDVARRFLLSLGVEVSPFLHFWKLGISQEWFRIRISCCQGFIEGLMVCGKIEKQVAGDLIDFLSWVHQYPQITTRTLRAWSGRFFREPKRFDAILRQAEGIE